VSVVLLVEDESLVALAQSEALTEAGFVVHTATSGSSALEAAETLSLSAAIIDMGLPDCGGDQVARQLRARNPALPILICTGYDTAALAKTTKDLLVRLIEKPIDEASLISILREHIQNFGRTSSPPGERVAPEAT
jgi:CheY-like chemotaxis protein